MQYAYAIPIKYEMFDRETLRKQSGDSFGSFLGSCVGGSVGVSGARWLTVGETAGAPFPTTPSEFVSLKSQHPVVPVPVPLDDTADGGALWC